MQNGHSHVEAQSPHDEVVPPIVVVEGQDVMLFRTESDLRAELEPWYPSSADYRAYDREGRRLELFADPPVVERRLIGPIWTDNAHESSLFVRPTETTPSHAEELASALRDWLQATGVKIPDSERLMLPELVDRALRASAPR